ncbi:Electron transfer DM13 [compost metagenome]
MKKLMFFLVLDLFFHSCIRENTSTEDLMEMAPENAELTYSGKFFKGPYGSNVGGNAEIYKKNDVYSLVFDAAFSVSNGPDLYVYVSKEQQPETFISLGKLKSVNGGQVYTFTSAPDFDSYRYVVVHCQQYNHLFAYSLLQKK